MTRVCFFARTGFASLVLSAFAGVASADVPPREPTRPSDDAPHQETHRNRPAGTCGTGASLSLLGIGAAWGLTWVGYRVTRCRRHEVA